MRRLSLLVCGLLSACSPEAPRAVEWSLEFDQPIRQLEEILEVESTQQGMNFTSANLGFLYDAKLHHLFRDHVATLSPEEARAAWAEQEKWLARRQRATSEAAAEFEDGSLASFAGSQSFIHMTRERIEALESRVN